MGTKDMGNGLKRRWMAASFRRKQREKRHMYIRSWPDSSVQALGGVWSIPLLSITDTKNERKVHKPAIEHSTYIVSYTKGNLPGIWFGIYLYWVSSVMNSA